MIIPIFKIPVYGIMIVLSMVVGMLYIAYSMKKEIKKNNQILLYFLMYITFAFALGKMYTIMSEGHTDIMRAGLSSYGGLVGVIVASFIFEKILPMNGKIIKYSILSLPLVYGISKIGCALVGCCGGIPYEGIGKVKYLADQNIWQFPIQITETIVFILLFVLCQRYKEKKNMEYIVLWMTIILKFLLDFLRYDHVNTLLTKNQFFSIFLIFISAIPFIYNKIGKNKIIR